MLATLFNRKAKTVSDKHFALDVTDDSFADEVIASEIPVLVDFWAPWCGPCRMVGPIVEEIAEEYSGRVKVAKLNTDDNPKIAAAYGIRSIPTINLYVGGEIVKTIVGVRPKRELVAEIDALLA